MWKDCWTESGHPCIKQIYQMNTDTNQSQPIYGHVQFNVVIGDRFNNHRRPKHFEKCNRKDFGRFEWYKNLAAKPQLVPRGLLYVPHYELPTYGKRSFAYAGPAM